MLKGYIGTYMYTVIESIQPKEKVFRITPVCCSLHWGEGGTTGMHCLYTPVHLEKGSWWVHMHRTWTHRAETLIAVLLFCLFVCSFLKFTLFFNANFGHIISPQQWWEHWFSLIRISVSTLCSLGDKLTQSNMITEPRSYSEFFYMAVYCCLFILIDVY